MGGAPAGHRPAGEDLRRRLKDGEIVDFVRRHRPVRRDDQNCHPYAVTRLIRGGELLVCYTPRGQVLTAAD